MKGSIRAGVGFLIAYGAVGGMDNPETSLTLLVAVALVGLAIMASGVKAINQQ